MTVSKTQDCAVWNMAPPFPILHGTLVETESVRELLASQFHALPKHQNVLYSGIVDNNMARQFYFAAHLGKNLALASGGVAHAGIQANANCIAFFLFTHFILCCIIWSHIYFILYIPI